MELVNLTGVDLELATGDHYTLFPAAHWAIVRRPDRRETLVAGVRADETVRADVFVKHLATGRVESWFEFCDALAGRMAGAEYVFLVTPATAYALRDSESFTGVPVYVRLNDATLRRVDPHA
jgi:hypothetical protein